MGQYLVDLYNAGKLGTIDLVNGIRLGTSDITMNPGNSGLINGDGWQPMYNFNQDQVMGRVWKDKSTRPIVVAFPAAGGGEWVIELIMQKDKTVAPNAFLLPAGWDAPNGGTVGAVRRFTEGDPMYNGGNATIVPVEFKTAEACMKYVKTDALAPYCQQAVDNRAKIRALYTQMVNTGYVPEALKSGEVYTVAGLQRVADSQ